MTVRVLVVDDESDVERLFKRQFRRELRDGSLAFKFADSGVSALEALRSQHELEFMLILSDINMPEMSGIELLEQVRNRYPALPVAMITAYDSDERRERAIALGAVGYLTKPIDFGALREMIPRLAERGAR